MTIAEAGARRGVRRERGNDHISDDHICDDLISDDLISDDLISDDLISDDLISDELISDGAGWRHDRPHDLQAPCLAGSGGEGGAAEVRT